MTGVQEALVCVCVCVCVPACACVCVCLHSCVCACDLLVESLTCAVRDSGDGPTIAAGFDFIDIRGHATSKNFLYQWPLKVGGRLPVPGYLDTCNSWCTVTTNGW